MIIWIFCSDILIHSLVMMSISPVSTVIFPKQRVRRQCCLRERVKSWFGSLRFPEVYYFDISPVTQKDTEGHRGTQRDRGEHKFYVGTKQQCTFTINRPQKLKLLRCFILGESGKIDQLFLPIRDSLHPDFWAF